ncbi:MAG: hypothetical protein ACHQ0J_09395 [Candidatus Dormibacterales bacterium]
MAPSGPEPLGQPSAIKQVRQVVFTDILAAATVFPKGYLKRQVAQGFGWSGGLLAARATDPLPPTPLYIVMTPTELRLLAVSGWRKPPYELGRWNRLTYRASIPERGAFLKLDLDLERLGRIQVFAGLRNLRREVRPVFELVVQCASGPLA